MPTHHISAGYDDDATVGYASTSSVRSTTIQYIDNLTMIKGDGSRTNKTGKNETCNREKEWGKNDKLDQKRKGEQWKGREKKIYIFI